ncbi:UDP-glucose 4-epimerase GalE [Aquisalinus flavus]|uniref:UDP-glucose 4-epimerase n=1 Tax=Aquisalinus flavus TaxID=1526572 RepID=A0A8J2V380_9PROT|nr:UDP-glucose 4-epimerase GalE [Aquisalinus flavus]MBD0426243.1 UDP-glucose 4-epimerase GalE [Aquisalinus flavus]UNE48185.1 UDP-glucose 4-epimerase GalE [Aquisalinus flavus]GGD09483.1 UDP-glucose 4-epimerase GalE [Aquisalinus flavus]
MTSKTILLTGGAGYIGSHVALVLLEAGYEVVILDNFANSSPVAVSRIRQLTNREVLLIESDLADKGNNDATIDRLKEIGIAGAVHLAGLKAVGESVEKPDMYYDTNLNSTLNLVAILAECDARTVVFSSSATVYGDRNKSPVDENGLTGPTNPYGMTKFFNERILADQYGADERWKVINLRYFNPVGAHPTGQIGEDPLGTPNNLFPFIAQVAVGRREKLSVFGDDYDTPDGTGVRDYIHVMDLAEGHRAALDYALGQDRGFVRNINLGSGSGHSVLEVITAFGAAAGREIPYMIAPRRSGDVAEIYANAALAKELLAWQTTRSLEDMCRDHWAWQSQNPQGYRDAEEN